MPELPEVETIRRGVEPYVSGRRIEQVVVRDGRLRWPVPPNLPDYATGKRVRGVTRRGKYLIFDLGGDRLIVHLGMSGRLQVLKRAAEPRKHDHLDIRLSGGITLRFHDPRRFGAVLPWPADKPLHALLRDMGPEPFGDDFSGDYLFARSRGRRLPVKSFVMDGRIVVGVGNIYASEALFRAGIRPNRAAGRVGLAGWRRVIPAVRQVLDLAIKAGGTTLRDFAGAQGEAGYFQQELMVYGREGEGCRGCGTAIRRTVTGQRSSFFCPRCQS